MNQTLIDLAFVHPSPVHFALLLVLAASLSSCLVAAICVLCNVGGTLDCIHAAQRRHQQRKLSKQVPAVDVDSDEPLLQVTSPASSAAVIASAAQPSRGSFRAQSPPARSGFISGGGKYQNTKPFGDSRNLRSGVY